MSDRLEDLGHLLETLWMQLGDAPADGLRVMDLPQKVAAGELLIGIGPEGRRLLLPLGSQERKAFREDRRSDGVQLRLTTIGNAEAQAPYVDVVCLDDGLNWVFSTFAADLLIRIDRGDAAPQAVARTCLAGWRAFFAGGSSRLGTTQLAGLFGELSVLGRMDLDGPDVLDRWRGPLKEPHDFVGPTLDVEVKVTMATQSDVVEVHGIDQLLAPTDGRLLLAHLRLDTASADGRSVPELVRHLEERLPGPRLRALLAHIGYQRRHERHYEAARFDLGSERWFEVDNHFPMLTRNSFEDQQVPAGLSAFNYSVDLAAVQGAPLEPEQVDAAIAELSS